MGNEDITCQYCNDFFVEAIEDPTQLKHLESLYES